MCVQTYSSHLTNDDENIDADQRCTVATYGVLEVFFNLPLELGFSKMQIISSSSHSVKWNSVKVMINWIINRNRKSFLTGLYRSQSEAIIFHPILNLRQEFVDQDNRLFCPI